MTLDVGKWIDTLKVPVRYFLALLVAGIFLLSAPDPWLGRFGVTELREHHRVFIGIGTLLCMAMVLANVLAWIGKRIMWRTNERRLVKSLYTLSADEKRVLRNYVFGDSHTGYFPVGDGVIGGLEAKKMLYLSSAIVVSLQLPYNIQPWALKHLSIHPELLETGDDQPYSPRDPWRR